MNYQSRRLRVAQAGVRSENADMTETVSGGCQCGRIRYRVGIEDDDAYLCHCRMCQRAAGNVSLALKNVKRADVSWDPEPERYRSSPFARRGFCTNCGTSLTFEFDEGSDQMDLTVGSFDEPGRFRPVSHFGTESRHDAWLDTRGLPGTRTDEHPTLVKRWEEAGGPPDA